MNENSNEFEEFLLNRIDTINSNYFKIYKFSNSINMNQFLKILNLKPFYKNKIPITLVDDGIISNESSSADHNHNILEKECAVCYEKIQTNVYLRKLICNHEFHKKCIDKWLFTQFKQNKKDFTCPICRHSIT